MPTAEATPAKPKNGAYTGHSSLIFTTMVLIIWDQIYSVGIDVSIYTNEI